MKISKHKGFTLIELMIVVAIVGILAALAVPAYNAYVVKTHLTEVLSLIGPAKQEIAESYNLQSSALPSHLYSMDNMPTSATVSTWSVFYGGSYIQIIAHINSSLISSVSDPQFMYVATIKNSGQSNQTLIFECGTRPSGYSQAIPSNYLPDTCVANNDFG